MWPPGSGETLACWREMRVSSRTTWLYGPRPTRQGASSEKRRPDSSPSTATNHAIGSPPACGSALQLFDRGVERRMEIERAIEPQQAKDLLGLRGKAGKMDRAAGRARALEQRDQDADTGRVDQRQLRQVDRDPRLATVGERNHFLLQPHRRRRIEAAGEGQHRHALALGSLELKHVTQPITYTCRRTRARRPRAGSYASCRTDLSAPPPCHRRRSSRPDTAPRTSASNRRPEDRRGRRTPC